MDASRKCRFVQVCGLTFGFPVIDSKAQKPWGTPPVAREVPVLAEPERDDSRSLCIIFAVAGAPDPHPGKGERS